MKAQVRLCTLPIQLNIAIHSFTRVAEKENEVLPKCGSNQSMLTENKINKELGRAIASTEHMLGVSQSKTLELSVLLQSILELELQLNHKFEYYDLLIHIIVRSC